MSTSLDPLYKVFNLPSLTRPPDKRAKLKMSSLISQPKHMLWVLKRTILLRRFF